MQCTTLFMTTSTGWRTRTSLTTWPQAWCGSRLGYSLPPLPSCHKTLGTMPLP